MKVATLATAHGRGTITLPKGVNPRRHIGQVLTKVQGQFGEGREVESSGMNAIALTVTRTAPVTHTAQSGKDILGLGRAQGTKPSDGDRIAARFEDAHPGYYLVSFDPFIGQARLANLTAEERGAREAITTAQRANPIWGTTIWRSADLEHSHQRPGRQIRDSLIDDEEVDHGPT